MYDVDFAIIILQRRKKEIMYYPFKTSFKRMQDVTIVY